LSKGTQISHTFGSHFKAEGARRVLRGWFHAEGPQILGVTTKFSHPGDLAAEIFISLLMSVC